MKRILTLLPALALLALALPLRADVYTIDPAHTQVGFEVKHLGLMHVHGKFTTWTAKISINEKDIARSKVEINIGAASVNTGIDQRDTHLRTPDFFDVAKYPDITFKSTKVAKAPDGTWLLSGDFSMHGVTLPLTLKAVLTEPLKTDWGTVVRGFSLEGSVNRLDFKIGPPTTSMVGGDVTLAIEGELDKPGEKKK